MPNFNDWTISKEHKDVVTSVIPAGLDLRPIQLHRTIPGVTRGRLTQDFRAGLWMAPEHSTNPQTFSCTHDIQRSTLFIAATGLTTSSESDTPPMMLLAEAVRTAFAFKRITSFIGELYSFHRLAPYDIDDSLVRKYDIIQFILTTRLREER